MKRFHLFIVIVVLVQLTVVSCKSKVVPADSKKYVIIDMDLGSSTDDIICLDLAYKYQREGKLEVLGVVVDRMGEQNAIMADILNTYYGYGNTPIGLERNGVEHPMLFIDYAPKMVAMRGKDGTPFFNRSVKDYSQVLNGYKLYRKLLAESPDHSVNIISCGFVTALSQLLESSGDEFSPLNGVELVRKKVQGLYLQAGMFEQAQEPDFNFKQVPSYARKFIALWPEDIPTHYNPMEIGQAIDYLPEMVLSDLETQKESPIYQIYKQCNCNTGQRMWDALNILWIMEGDSLLNISEKGQVTWNEDFSTSFKKDTQKNCQYLLPFSAGESAKVLSFIREKVKSK